MAFLARRLRGKQDPPATEATPSQPSSAINASIQSRTVPADGLDPAALAGKAIINSNPFHPDSRHDAEKRTCLYRLSCTVRHVLYVAILRFWQPDHHLERQQTHCTAAARTAGSLTTPSTTVLAPRPHLPTEIAVFKNPSSNVKPHRQSGFVISATSQPAASQATGPVGMIFGSKNPSRCGSWAPSAHQASAKSGLKVYGVKACKEGFSTCSAKSPEHSSRPRVLPRES
jgi:hypothetical protein